MSTETMIRLRSLLSAVLILPAFLISFSSETDGSGLNFSGDGSDAESRHDQRKLYQSLIFYIKSNQRTRYLKEAPKLKSYPLYPYLEYTDKIHHLSRQKKSDIAHFIEQYDATPIASQLRQNYLYTLARKSHWKTFVEFYRAEDTTKDNRCHYPYALYKTGKHQDALNAAEKLWLVGYSQPDACDPIFKVWQAKGRLSHSLGWQRFNLSMQSGETSLAKFLTKYLSKSDKTLATEYLRGYKNPKRVVSSSRYPASNEKSAAIVLHLIRRLSRSDANLALSTLDNSVTKYAFSPDSVSELYRSIAVKLAKSDEFEALNQISANHRSQTDVVTALIVQALKKQDLSEALVQINRLDAEAQSLKRWQYWKARILLASQDVKDLQSAKQIFSQLATKRSYYGFMAADFLGQDYAFEHEAVDVTEDQLLNLESSPDMQRAFELLTLNQPIRARREWRSATKNFSLTELHIAAKLAQKWGWYNMSIQAMIKAKSWNDLDLRFPTAYLHHFTAASRAADIPVDWSLAISRQESAFRPDVRSGAGATGLMQLLYGTAKATAKREGLNLNGKSDLIKPEVNIQLGTAYLGQMLRRFDYNRIIASAAYNAGPTRVRRWVNKSMPLDIWIESIPYKETRSYVKNVLMFSAIYNQKLNKKTPLIFDHEKAHFAAMPTLPQTLRASLESTQQAPSTQAR